MNVDQIKNEEVRIFPYYKGKYLGVSPLGYSNVKSARKFMNPIPNSDVYAEFGGMEKYEFEHRYFYGLDKKRMYMFIDDLYYYIFFGGEFAYKSTLSTEVQKCIMNKNFPSVKDALKIFSSKG